MRKLIFISLLLISGALGAQVVDIGETNGSTGDPIETLVQFLTIAPDSRSGAMGDVGVATEPDAYAQHWNPAKYAFTESEVGGALSYVPWLSNLNAGITLTNLVGYYRFEEKQTVSASLYYFNLGEINLTDNTGYIYEQVVPTEFSIDGAYTRKFSPKVSASVGLRYIYSGILKSAQSTNDNPYKAGISIAADMAMYYQDDIQLSDKDGQLAFGVNLSNLGNKMSYQDNGREMYIPTNLRVGGRLTTNIDAYNKISFAADFNKLLVPSPQEEDAHLKHSPIEGVFVSFTDTDFKEEMQEIMISAGVEYWYQNQFALRSGIFYENKNKGGRQYATVGFGFKLNMLDFDFSYLIPYGTNNSPLEGTMRFSLGININK